MSEVPYLTETGVAAFARVTPELVLEIKSAIDREGHWEDTGEWRISTYMTRRIAVTEAHDRRWYEVTVTSGNEMKCHAPTLERALQFMFIYQRLVMDLFWTLGWPSWAERRDPAPKSGDTLP